MQVPQADSGQSKRVGVDEQFIRFRSSPNFKGMKKFIKSKIDNIETSNRSSPTNLPDPPPPPNLDASLKSEGQPADTLESAESSPKPQVQTKADNEREKYTDGDSSESFPSQDNTTTGYDSESTEDQGKTQESTIMCRDFVRGTCKRPGNCRYAHKCDTSQLVGVYTFCRDFQNRICTLPNCKYVHASIFEEQNFYRTGKLPPHVLAHKSAAPPPPPPPPAEPEPRIDIPTSFSNPPPPLATSMETNPAMLACLPLQASLPPSALLTSPMSDPRRYQDEFMGVGGADGGHQPKGCKSCGIMDIRVRCLKSLTEKKRDSVEEWKRKVVEMERKKEKMSALVLGLLQLTSSSGPSTLFNILSVDKTQTITEQLTKLNSNNRLSMLSEDSSWKGVLTDNFGIASLMAKLLAEQQSLAGGAGRKD